MFYGCGLVCLLVVEYVVFAWMLVGFRGGFPEQAVHIDQIWENGWFFFGGRFLTCSEKKPRYSIEI
jgi:hypothetical protein